MTKSTPPCMKMKVFILLSFLIFTYANSQQSHLYNQEHEILMRIKNHFQNPSFLSHWTKSNTSSHCSWPEIHCTKNSVTSLLLFNKNITQTLPPFLCELKNLTYIDFQLNYFPNEFPTS